VPARPLLLGFAVLVPLLLAGFAVGASCGGRMGDSGSRTGRGGVDERGGACLYCDLNEDTRIAAVGGV